MDTTLEMTEAVCGVRSEGDLRSLQQNVRTAQALFEVIKMDMPFPITTPRFIDSKWFNADNPCDDETELAALEQSNQEWLSSVGQQFKARAPLGKTDPEPMEECESEEEEGNEESDDSEESHDEDEEEDLQQTYPPRNQNEQTPPVDLTDSSEPNISEQSTLWP